MVYDCLVYFSIHWAKAPILYAFFNEWAKAQSNSKWMTPMSIPIHKFYPLLNENILEFKDFFELPPALAGGLK